MDTGCSIKKICKVVTNVEVSEMKNMLSGLPLECVGCWYLYHNAK